MSGKSVRLDWPGKLSAAQLAAMADGDIDGMRAGRREGGRARHGDAETRGRGHAVGEDGEHGNRIYHGDNLAVLRALAGERPGTIELIYIDPPFCAGKDFHTTKTAAKKELAFTDRWEGGMSGYLTMMQQRLWLMRELLSPRGSIYIHCDYRASAHLRLLMDEMFGAENLRAEIVWHYQSGGRARSCYAMKHDTLLLYSRGGKWTFNADAVSSRRGTEKRNHMKRETGADGRVFFSIKSAGKIYRYYEDELVAPADVWCDISHLQQKDPERTGYATQKPLTLLKRVILASSNPGEWVADFFCGSGTTAVAAALAGRRWIVSDQSELAIETTRKRLGEWPGLEAAGYAVLRA